MRFRSLMNIAVFLALSGTSTAQDTPLPRVEEVMEHVAARDAQRQLMQEGYAGMRRYVLVNERFNKRAEMVVSVNGDPDGTKHFEVLAESGWKSAQKRVLRKMLESEAETSRPEVRVGTRLTMDNYEFQMVGSEKVGEQTLYAIDVSPKRKDKYLFRGRIWVDAQDYAVVRVDGNPAKNPSFWTKRVHFVHTYQKTGEFWFPVTTESVTDALLFGRTDLTIEYFEYKPKASLSSEKSTIVAQKGAQR